MKEYGKLTGDQLREVVGYIPSVLARMREMEEEFEKTPQAKFDAVMTGDFGSYCEFYEHPFLAHLLALITALNMGDEIIAMAAAPDPQQAVLDDLRQSLGNQKPHNPVFEMGEVIALVYSFGRTIQSLATYGRSISSLLAAARERNDQDALFKAIRMDRAVVGCPTAMRLIVKAQMRGNKAFFARLRASLGGPSKKEWVGLDQLRYALVLLREMGLDDLSQAEIETLMVDKLGIYKPGKGNARKNLWAHYTQSRKLRSI
jgi:hypothetical protein